VRKPPRLLEPSRGLSGQEQTERNDIVGDLARDARGDHNWDDDSVGSLADHIRNLGIGWPALTALSVAAEEYGEPFTLNDDDDLE